MAMLNNQMVHLVTSSHEHIGNQWKPMGHISTPFMLIWAWFKPYKILDISRYFVKVHHFSQIRQDFDHAEACAGLFHGARRFSEKMTSLILIENCDLPIENRDLPIDSMVIFHSYNWYNNWLVVWNMNVIFPNSWMMIQSDELHHFSGG